MLLKIIHLGIPKVPKKKHDKNHIISLAEQNLISLSLQK